MLLLLLSKAAGLELPPSLLCLQTASGRLSYQLQLEPVSYSSNMKPSSDLSARCCFILSNGHSSGLQTLCLFL